MLRLNTVKLYLGFSWCNLISAAFKDKHFLLNSFAVFSVDFCSKPTVAFEFDSVFGHPAPSSAKKRKKSLCFI